MTTTRTAPITRKNPQNTTPETIDPAAAAAALDQLANDRNDNAERLMAPKWWYPVNGMITGLYYLLASQLVTLYSAEFGADAWKIEIHVGLLRSVLLTVAFLAMLRAVLALGEWRKQQIGSDYSVIMGELRPRTPLMWVSLIAQLIVIVLAFVPIVWWAFHPTVLPDTPLLVAVTMGGIGWLWDYLYDRHFVATVKKGRQ